MDLVRVLLGLSIFGIGFLIAQRGQLSVFERDVFRVVNDLPGIVFPVVWALMQLGNAVAVPLVAAGALLARRVRMARDLLLSGLLSYVGADVVKSVVGRERPAGLIQANLLDGNVTGIGFISGHAAVAAALATAAVPYLTRRAVVAFRLLTFWEELSYVAGLSAAGVQPAAAAAAVLLFRFQTWFVPIPLGLAAWLLWRRGVGRVAPALPAAVAA